MQDDEVLLLFNLIMGYDSMAWDWGVGRSGVLRYGAIATSSLRMISVFCLLISLTITTS